MGAKSRQQFTSTYFFLLYIIPLQNPHLCRLPPKFYSSLVRVKGSEKFSPFFPYSAFYILQNKIRHNVLRMHNGRFDG
jgi:hypothetical protein